MGLFNRDKTPRPTTSAGGGEVTLDGATYTITSVVDCIGDSCPRPQLMTQKALAAAQAGEVLEVRIDNPTSMEAIPPMMPQLGAAHLGTLKTERYWRVFVSRD